MKLLLKIGVILLAVLSVASPPTGHIFSAAAASSGPCAAPEYRQFDFWVGDWDARRIRAGRLGLTSTAR
ncbi:MAG: hypothetical protein ACR2JB_29560 [Bryobacteraceae bacterium]